MSFERRTLAETLVPGFKAWHVGSIFDQFEPSMDLWSQGNVTDTEVVAGHVWVSVQLCV